MGETSEDWETPLSQVAGGLTFRGSRGQRFKSCGPDRAGASSTRRGCRPRLFLPAKHPALALLARLGRGGSVSQFKIELS